MEIIGGNELYLDHWKMVEIIGGNELYLDHSGPHG